MKVVIPGATTFNVDDNAGIGVSFRPTSVHEENDGTSCQPNDVVQIPSQEKKQKMLGLLINKMISHKQNGRRWGDFFLPPQLHGWKEVESW
ncbi:hypothetical protein KY290_030957 [Solanum tuberosum]|uniref:Uncharacterized protein n=1 Tax=Solanum tuberosum TaxID=4113 RepID=A0ABQ7U8N3_SOLTU|nr:hypothetical protein KY285_031894 [Solanum tuberosum]KAH0742964.1 hypothetical protein KY290_030957 [Solanum tuberosum]